MTVKMCSSTVKVDIVMHFYGPACLHGNCIVVVYDSIMYTKYHNRKFKHIGSYMLL